MSVKVIIGPANSGKSFSLCNEMVNRAVAEPGRRFIAIVPEQFTLQMQRRVVTLHPRHSVMNIDIVSFNRLAHRVFSELGRDEKNVLDDTGKALILRKLLTDIRDDLEVYANKIGMPGFVEEIKSIITELKQYGIKDEQLALMETAALDKGNMLLHGKLKDIRLIYRKFNERIEDSFTTAEEVLEIFARMVPESQLIEGTSIYLDGFTGFTPVQYRLLEELMKKAKDVTLAFSLPEEKMRADCPEYDLFYMSNQCINKLRAIAEKTNNDYVILPLAAENKEPAKVYKYCAPNTREEVVFIAGKIRELVKQGLRYRDMAVITNDMEEYYPSFRDVFEEAGITCFIDYKSELSENPLSRFVLAALELAESGFSYDGVFGYLKSGMTDLTNDEISRLENYCLEFGIRGHRNFENEFVKNRPLYKDEEFFWDLEEINGIRSRMMEKLIPYYAEVRSKAPSARVYASALNKLIEANGIADKLDGMKKEFEESGNLSLAKEYEQIMDLTKDLLEKSASLMADEPVTIHEYIEVITAGLKEIKVGIIPPGLDALAVGDLTRSRFNKLKVLFFAGLNEGTVPKAASGSGIFTRKERDFLKEQDFELAPGVLENIYSQRFYLYLMLAKPSQQLYLTYAKAKMGGDQMEPSTVLDELKDYMECGEAEEITVIPDVTWKSKAVKDAAKAVSAYINYGKAIESGDQALLRFFAENDAETFNQILQGGFYTNKTTSLDKQVALDLYGDVLKGSVSRYEVFSQCAFRHFLSYGLRLENRPEYKVEATDIGTLYHDSLELYSKKLEAEGLSFRDVNDETSHRIADESVQAAIEKMTYDVIESTARNEYLLKRIKDVTIKTTDVLRAHVHAGLYDPAKYEWTFESNIGTDVNFRGKIDRVDIYDGEDMYVKIIDYKSGYKAFNIKDIYTGKQLQLVAYLKEAIKDVSDKHPYKNVKPGGVYYYLIGDRYVEKENVENKYKMSGLTASDAEALKAVDANLFDGEKKKSSIVNVSLTSKGLDARSSIAGQSDFAGLMEFVEKKIISISEEIKSGNIDINPYDEGTNNACTYCDYKDICKFEDDTFGVEYRDPCSLKKEEIETIVYGRTAAKEEEDA